MTWFYSQRTGVLRHGEDIEATGYSGYALGKNNPDMQNVHDIGPIPRGEYQIGTPRDTAEHGPFVLPLAASMENVMHGRSGFLIHGDSIAAPGTASHGCIILGKAAREQIAASLDNDLKVTE